MGIRNGQLEQHTIFRASKIIKVVFYAYRYLARCVKSILSYGKIFSEFVGQIYVKPLQLGRMEMHNGQRDRTIFS